VQSELNAKILSLHGLGFGRHHQYHGKHDQKDPFHKQFGFLSTTKILAES
jgi:hypothetical protein